MERNSRIEKLVANLYAKPPEIESARARLITESYKSTEHLPIILRRAYAFANVLDNIPIVIRDGELIVGSPTIAPRGCQTFPEYSYEWLEAEFDTVAARTADPFYISGEAKTELREANAYWRGKTVNDLATVNMAPETERSIRHNMFTVGNYFFNGVGHVCVDYAKVLRIGYDGIIAKTRELRAACKPGDGDYARRTAFLDAVIISCEGVIRYAKRYAALAGETAARCNDPVRKAELEKISRNCQNVPAKGAANFFEACQSFWFIQMLIQLEGSGHSISPGRFDQYMYPYYRSDLDAGKISQDSAQELLDCIWVKLNDLNKCRDGESAKGFSGYSLFQNLIVGGQDSGGNDATNALSYMCIEASRRVFLPMPSLSIRIWNGTPQPLFLKAAELTRTGIGLPAYFNDEVIIPSLLNRGLSLEEARNYCIIGCVEPQIAGKTDGWHDAAFFNMCRPMELVFSNGYDEGELVGVNTGEPEDLKTFEEFFSAYKAQMNYQIELLVNADNAVDAAHMSRAPLPFLACMVDDCLSRALTPQEGGAVYNFTGPQGFGVANVADALYAIRTLVYEQRKYTLSQIKQALAFNFGKPTPQMVTAIATEVIKKTGSATSEKNIAEVVRTIAEVSGKLFNTIYEDINALPKFGNDVDEVDALAREAAYCYTLPMEKYKNPRGGIFQTGLYPVSANVPMGAQTGATPDGRLAGTPLADGVSPSAGKDLLGPTAAANSVAKLDHFIPSNGTLFNQKFHPSALKDERGLFNFISLIRAYFDQKGSHMQFNVVDRATLLDAQRNPENYANLIVRVAGYSALFTTLSKPLQDDIIKRTEQGL